MDSGIILIIALIIIGFAITWSNQGQVREVELRQSQFEKEKNELAEHDNRSSNDVDTQRNEMLKKSNGKKTIPQIFFDDYHVGGYKELRSLEKKGELDSLLK